MNAAQVNLNLRPQKEIDLAAPEQALSALVDGELDAALLEGLLAADPGRAEVFASWHAYHVIGDVLRGNRVVTPLHAPGDFLAGVRERLKSEPAPVDDGPRLLQSHRPRWCGRLQPMTRCSAGSSWLVWRRWRP